MRGYTILGTDIATPLKALAEGAQQVTTYAEARDASNKAEKKTQDDLLKSVKADQAATTAGATALASSDSKSSSAEADKAAYDLASAAQDDAARGLSSENQKKRADQARDDLASATKLWQTAAAGKNEAATKLASFRVKASQISYGKTQNAMLVKDALPGGASESGKGKAGGSWLTKSAAGLPVYGWGLLGVGVAAAATAGVMILRRR